MAKDNDQKRIVSDPAVLVGKPVIKGTRVPVSLILNLLAHGYTVERVLQAYPVLKSKDIQAALEYAEGIIGREQIVDSDRVVHAKAVT